VSNAFKGLMIVLALMLLASGCGKKSSWDGIYTNANSSIVLEVKSGGKASLALMGEKKDCTYTTDGDKSITLDCNMGDKLTLTKQADGSLAGPPGSLIPPLQKKS
jgi:hypothetical protein